MAAPAATTATPPFASRQPGGEGLFALKSLASARPPGPGQQRSLREPKPVVSAGKSKIPCGRGVTRARLQNSAAAARAGADAHTVLATVGVDDSQTCMSAVSSVGRHPLRAGGPSG